MSDTPTTQEALIKMHLDALDRSVSSGFATYLSHATLVTLLIDAGLFTRSQYLSRLKEMQANLPDTHRGRNADSHLSAIRLLLSEDDLRASLKVIEGGLSDEDQ